MSLELDGLWLPEDAVALRTPYEEWAKADRPKPTNASPAVFGVAEAALALLDEDTSAPLRTRLDEVRKEAYALAEHPVPHEYLAERLALRTRAYEG